MDIDAVAQHVVRLKHDITYNERLVPDDIGHVFEYSMFEDVVENLDEFMEQHGRKFPCVSLHHSFQTNITKTYRPIISYRYHLRWTTVQ